VDPINFAETLIASLDESSEKTAIIIDEISYFFLALAECDAAQAHKFAYKLRALQQRYQRVRWVITGSIGLDTIARRHGLEGAFVDFETFLLEPFTSDEARSYMRDPTIQQQFNHIFDARDEDLDYVFAELGWLAPYYLKMIANEVCPSHIGESGKPATATRADFEAAFRKLLAPNRRSEFAVWREHIQKNLPIGDRTIASQLLDGLSQSAAGENLDTLLAQVSNIQANPQRRHIRDILSMLLNDGLIKLDNGKYSFRSGLIRRFWKEYEAE
jgi:hypothetical protein